MEIFILQEREFMGFMRCKLTSNAYFKELYMSDSN